MLPLIYIYICVCEIKKSDHIIHTCLAMERVECLTIINDSKEEIINLDISMDRNPHTCGDAHC